MVMQKIYYRIVWENYPSNKTPLNEQNLNKIDVAVDGMDNRIISLDTTKFDKTEAQQLIKFIEYDENTGIFKITHYNGASYTIDTLLEKLAINFDYDYQTQRLIITLSDGTIKYVDLSALITQYEFLDSDTCAFELKPDGKVTVKVKEGSIEEKHLRPNYLADIKVEAAKAQQSATQAAVSATTASVCAYNAKQSENAARISQTESKKSELAAIASAESAEENKNIVVSGIETASICAFEAKESAKIAKENADIAIENSATAADAAASAENYADTAQSYAIGTDNVVRPNDSEDNSKFYSELARQLTDEAQKLLEQAQKIIAAASSGALIPSGTVAFENLPTEPQTGHMYNISNDFVTDERFAEGAGIFYRAGANVYWTADEKWDVLVGAQVTGVKGEAENTYHVGNVNITRANIGLGNVNNTADRDKPVSTAQQAALNNKVNKTGDTLNGRYVYQKGASIAFRGTYRTSDLITFIDDNNNSDSYGNGIRIGKDGLVLIASGESGELFQDIGGASENTYIASDSTIFLTPGCQSGHDANKDTTIESNGYVNAPFVGARKHENIVKGLLPSLPNGRSQLMGDGLWISNPATKNDQGWVRMLGTGETDSVLEIATGDDGGAGERIVVRQYNTANAVAHELVLLGNSGQTEFKQYATFNTPNNTECDIRILRNGRQKMAVGTGNDNVNYGIWDYTLNKWMVHSNGSKIYLNGTARSADSAINDIAGNIIHETYLKGINRSILFSPSNTISILGGAQYAFRTSNTGISTNSGDFCNFSMNLEISAATSMFNKYLEIQVSGIGRVTNYEHIFFIHNYICSIPYASTARKRYCLVNDAFELGRACEDFWFKIVITNSAGVKLDIYLDISNINIFYNKK